MSIRKLENLVHEFKRGGGGGGGEGGALSFN